MERLESEGKTVILASIDGQFAGLVAVADTVKESSKKAIERLHKMKMDVIMMTGDNERTAQAIARQVGITRIIAEVLPEEKTAQIKKLQGMGKRLPW